MVFVFECCIVAICSPRICGMFATLLQIVRNIVAIRSPRIRRMSPHCCNPFATFSHLISSVVAICLQAKKPKLSMCIEAFRPPKIL